MCAKCAKHHAPPPKLSTKLPKKRLVSATFKDKAGQVELSDYCPVHGFKEVLDTDSNTELNPSKRVNYRDITILMSN